jgi:Fe-S cluster assembly iron-binding protein IscA
LGIALDEPNAADEIIEIDDLQIAFSPMLKFYLSGKIVDYQKDFFGHWDYLVYGTASCN